MASKARFEVGFVLRKLEVGGVVDGVVGVSKYPLVVGEVLVVSGEAGGHLFRAGFDDSQFERGVVDGVVGVSK